MIKKISIFVLITLFSCNYNLSNSNKIIIEDKNKILENKFNFQYKENFAKLKKLFKDNNKSSFNQVYFDDNNNGMIIFGDKMYILDKELNIVKIHELGEDKGYVFSKPLVDNNGNGVIFYSSPLVTSFSTEQIKKIENFIFTESKIMDYGKYIPKINIESYNNYLGKGYYFYNDEKELILSDIEGFFNYKETKKFKLDNKERFNSIILNKNNDGIVITLEKDENNNLTYRYYTLKNNELDLKQGKIIEHNFEKGEEPRIYGKLDKIGNGFIYIDNYIKNKLEIKIIKNFEIKKEYFSFQNMRSIHTNLDELGNGFILTGADVNIYLKKVNNFIIQSSEIILENINPLGFRVSINSKGTGFIVSGKINYKDNNPANYNDFTIDNELFFIFENNLIK